MPPPTAKSWQDLFAQVYDMFGIKEKSQEFFGSDTIPPPWEIIERYEAHSVDADIADEIIVSDEEVQTVSTDTNPGGMEPAGLGLAGVLAVETGASLMGFVKR